MLYIIIMVVLFVVIVGAPTRSEREWKERKLAKLKRRTCSTDVLKTESKGDK